MIFLNGGKLDAIIGSPAAMYSKSFVGDPKKGVPSGLGPIAVAV